MRGEEYLVVAAVTGHELKTRSGAPSLAEEAAGGYPSGTQRESVR
jgi:hypothetical protein